MSMPTAARVQGNQDSHWYSRSGEPCHTVPYADGTGERPPTLADAKKHRWIPSVTTYLKTLAKPGLEAWKTEMAILACLTTPRVEREEIDEYVKRVLSTERQQDQEAKAAADLGARIHKAMEDVFAGQFAVEDLDLCPWIKQAVSEVRKLCPTVLHVEKVLVGEACACRCDFIGRDAGTIWVIDWKSCKTIPKKPWPEHNLQLSFAANVIYEQRVKDVEWSRWSNTIRTANVYISTVDVGKFAVLENPPWLDTYEHGFRPLVDLTCWMWGYDPRKEP